MADLLSIHLAADKVLHARHSYWLSFTRLSVLSNGMCLQFALTAPNNRCNFLGTLHECGTGEEIIKIDIQLVSI